MVEQNQTRNEGPVTWDPYASKIETHALQAQLAAAPRPDASTRVDESDEQLESTPDALSSLDPLATKGQWAHFKLLVSEIDSARAEGKSGIRNRSVTDHIDSALGYRQITGTQASILRAYATAVPSTTSTIPFAPSSSAQPPQPATKPFYG